MREKLLVSASNTGTHAVERWRLVCAGWTLGVAAGGVALDIQPFDWPVSFSNVLVIATAVLILPLLRKPRLLITRLSWFDAMFVLYLIARLGMELINAVSLDHRASLGLVFETGVLYLATWIARLLVTDLQSFSIFLRHFSLIGIAVSLIALLQVLNVPGVSSWLQAITSSPGLDLWIERNWSVRATSTLGHWSALGGYLVCILTAVCVGVILAVRNGKNVGLLRLLTLVSLIIGLASTLTLAPILLGAIICLVTLVSAKPPRVVVASLIAGAAVTIAALWNPLLDRVLHQFVDERVGDKAETSANYPWLPETVAFRLDIWLSETLPAILQRPLTGWGVDVYNTASGWPLTPGVLEWSSPESEWFRTALTIGILGLSIQALLLATVWLLVLRPGLKAFGRPFLPIAILFFGLLVMSFIHSYLTNLGAPLPFWIIVGLALGLLQGHHAPSEVALAIRPLQPSGTPRKEI